MPPVGARVLDPGLQTDAGHRVVLAALLRAGGRRGGRTATQVKRQLPHRAVLANVTTVLDDLATGDFVDKSGALYSITDDGLVEVRSHPNPRTN